MAKLLVIHDDEQILQFLCVLLTEPEVAVLTAATAAEGLALFAADRPDAVLLDIDLADRPFVATSGPACPPT
jgi:DNA-binding response OmpR family regulator